MFKLIMLPLIILLGLESSTSLQSPTDSSIFNVCRT